VGRSAVGSYVGRLTAFGRLGHAILGAKKMGGKAQVPPRAAASRPVTASRFFYIFPLIFQNKYSQSNLPNLYTYCHVRRWLGPNLVLYDGRILTAVPHGH
jgi:hypothetical protein